MSLYVVATPIGNLGDITLRALEILKSADVVIGEERKEAAKLLKRLDVKKDIELLNEHSQESDIKSLVDLCRDKTVALISDCGTPGFCDPGALLVDRCRKAGISVTAVPGASSLMAFLSLCGVPIKEFHFCGFLPTNKEERQKALQSLRKLRSPLILMDTPYRLNRLLEDVATHFPDSQCTIGIDLTLGTEKVLKGTAQNLLKQLNGQKAEFVLLVHS